MNKEISVCLIFISSFLYSQNNVDFSHLPGFYDTSFYLKVNPRIGNVIYSYQNNLNKRSKVFKDSLLIDKTTTISFGLYHGDSIVELGSRSYFIDFITKFNVVALTVSNKDLYDSIRGIYVDGPNAYYDTVLNVMLNSNYSKKSERNVYVEVFDKVGQIIISQDAGLRIFGGMTIYYPEKSLRVIARKKYGVSRFKANIFNQGHKEYKQFILRHSGNDYRKTRFKDALSTNLATEGGLDVQSSLPSHLFVNSEYWGVYNIREKLNEYYIDNHYNCGTESVDMLQAFRFVEEGTGEKYEELLDFIYNNDIGSDINYQYVNSLMDCRNFAQFWIHQIYFSNTDVRGNIRFWRSDSLDGRFRWILYDTDLGWSDYNSTLLDDFTSPIKTEWYNPTWATFLLRTLFENQIFTDYFINQTAFLMSTSLNTNHVNKKIEEFKDLYKEEMIYHFNYRKKFQNYQGNINNWEKEVDQLKFFALKRDDILLDQVEKKFDLSTLYNLIIEIENFDKGAVLLNHNQLKSEKFSGQFFSDLEVPISVIPNPGYSCKGWTDSYILNENTEDIVINISFVRNKESDHNLIINEIDYLNDCFEIYNQGNSSVDLEGWNIVDNHNNIDTIDSAVLESGRFAVFHFNHLIDKIDTVIYKKINFKLSSDHDLIKMFDNKGCLVDSVSYSLNKLDNSYSRNIPLEDLDDIKVNWRNNSDLTMGFHNQSYTKLLSDTLQKQQQMRMLYIILGCLIIITVIVLIRRRSKRKKIT